MMKGLWSLFTPAGGAQRYQCEMHHFRFFFIFRAQPCSAHRQEDTKHRSYRTWFDTHLSKSDEAGCKLWGDSCNILSSGSSLQWFPTKEVVKSYHTISRVMKQSLVPLFLGSLLTFLACFVRGISQEVAVCIHQRPYLEVLKVKLQPPIKLLQTKSCVKLLNPIFQFHAASKWFGYNSAQSHYCPPPAAWAYLPSLHHVLN